MKFTTNEIFEDFYGTMLLSLNYKLQRLYERKMLRGIVFINENRTSPWQERTFFCETVKWVHHDSAGPDFTTDNGLIYSFHPDSKIEVLP